SRLANPAAVVDAEGTLVYFNEAAEPILGLTYAEAGGLRAGGWATQMRPRDPNGDRIPPEELPLGVRFPEGPPSPPPPTIPGGRAVTGGGEDEGGRRRGSRDRVDGDPPVPARRPDPGCGRPVLGAIPPGRRLTTMRATIWGSRGTLASPGPDTVRYGGQTSCV